ncbi:hypothetical protein JCM11641_001851 [Rhodosporidiobolus odoratus]
MATFPPSIPIYQPGKPPLLFDASHSGINTFLRLARLYFRQKKIDADEDKVSYLGEGLVMFPELYNWFNASVKIHEAKVYKTFVADLQKRALPRDYVWEAKDNKANPAFPSTTPTVYATTIDYSAFDIEARNKWSKIASH